MLKKVDLKINYKIELFANRIYWKYSFCASTKKVGSFQNIDVYLTCKRMYLDTDYYTIFFFIDIHLRVFYYSGKIDLVYKKAFS